ncbi:MAG: hypothetical protein WD598_18055 [Acidimicrobiia bacterium]
MPESKKVQLRSERSERDTRNLWAYCDAEGNLHIDGQDLGPATAMVSSDGEYEWFHTIAAEHVPRVLALLGGEPGSNILELLKERFCGENSYELERRLRESDIPMDLHTWSG